MFLKSKPAVVNERSGNMRWGLIAMLLGAPLPVILLAFLFMRGCQ